MTWYYRAMRRKIQGDWFYEVHEYFTNMGSKLKDSYTIGSVYPEGKTKKELIKDIENMLEDVKNHTVRTIKEDD